MPDILVNHGAKKASFTSDMGFHKHKLEQIFTSSKHLFECIDTLKVFSHQISHVIEGADVQTLDREHMSFVQVRSHKQHLQKPISHS